MKSSEIVFCVLFYLVGMWAAVSAGYAYGKGDLSDTFVNSCVLVFCQFMVFVTYRMYKLDKKEVSPS